MARRSKEDSLETRERLLDAALEVFHARGASGPSLSDIAALAGVTRGAVYVHFENKADLFSALCERTLLPMDAVRCEEAGAKGPLARLRALCAYQMHQTATDPRYRKMSDILFFRCEHNEENRAIIERRRERRGQCINARRALGAEAMAAGELPPDLDLDRAIALLQAGVMGVIREWLWDPAQFDLAAEADPYADALIEMIRTSPTLRRPATS
ncbi:MAG: TetR family transcriptional regulator [Pseudomonadota bacterium]|nr:TetR family transcriptional regulator [Pseudomonadota bacterium]